ncbi:MAG: acylphosphatase [Burkholderiales bacterium]|jgi:acylphosphatase|nr:acylphosphatase [Burkholderiales bacterium]
MIARHLIISGRVQGVAFRYSLIVEARQRQLVGWVRNLRDGAVEAVIQGAKEDVEALTQWCRRGPSFADVTGLAVTDSVLDPALTTFEKRPTC